MQPDLTSLRSLLSRFFVRRTVWLRHGLFAAVALLVFWLLFQMGWSHYISTSHRNRYIQAVLKVSRVVEVLVLGSSHADGVKPELLSRPTVRVNFPAADLFAAEYQVHCLIDRMPRLKIALLSVSPFSFSWDNSALVNEQGKRVHADQRRWLYATYPCWCMIPGDYMMIYLQGKLRGLLTADHWEGMLGPCVNLFPKAKPPKKTAKPAKKAGTKTKHPPTRQGLQRILTLKAKRRSQALELDLNGMLAQDPDIPQRAIQSVLDLHRFLEDRGVRLVFFTPPYYEAFNQIFDQEQQNLMRRSMDRILSETHAEYLDYSHYPAISTNPFFYKDSDHLNEIGSREFTRLLNQALFPPDKVVNRAP